MTRRIGVFGGTFDPPHLGHLILASEAHWQLNLDQVYWVLTPNPPHKLRQTITSTEHRLQMVELAIASDPRFSLSTVDVNRLPPHYAVDTMRLLLAAQPGVEWFYLMGSDSVNELNTWHDPVQFLHSCDFLAVMLRSGDTLDRTALASIYPELEAKLKVLTTPTIEISASEIRKRTQLGEEFRYFVPDTVYEYIKMHKLYLD